ncbi:MAG: alpha/beta hydrolase family esterase [Promethearchaeota archaeon]
MRLKKVLISVSIAVIIISLITIGIIVSIIFLSSNSSQNYEFTLEYDGLERYYIVHVPSSYHENEKTPLVMVFHGGGGHPGSVQYESEMDQVSDKYGFIVVYPAGTPTNEYYKKKLLIWNDGRNFSDGTPNTVDDVGFVEEVLKDVKEKFNINDQMVYACGFSNGAQFTYRLSKQMTDKFAAVSTVAGQRPANDTFDLTPLSPISIMQFSGLNDPISLYDGGPPTVGEPLLEADAYPVVESIESWVDFNGCSLEPEENRIGAAVMEKYTSTENNTEVILWTLEDGGHTWPGGNIDPNVELLGLGDMGGINEDIHASELMWEFFKTHSLNINP